ncbi:MAG: FAD-dependent oxidoreductase [Desulfobacterales bacterium]|nr:MAG: FAD-dependent oxidoreductase [Desulfobacterales bacterium]
MFEKLFEPGVVNKMYVKNRLVLPPITTNYATEDGAVSDQMIAYYVERAKGGVGTIIVENAQVDYPGGKNVTLQSRIDDDKYIGGFGDLTEAVKVHGTRIVLQIQHSGRETTWAITEGHQPVAPSPIPCGFLKVQPRELTIPEIEDLIEKYVNAADRAKRAGFDGVEIHGAHGYLIAQFMDGYTNHRQDKYGGTFENRMRFPLEIIQRTRDKVGDDYPIYFRFCADEFVEGARKIDESVRIAQFMEQVAGVDYLDISMGIYESRWAITPPMAFRQGCMCEITAQIKEAVRIPVQVVGKIRTPEMAEEILAQGQADFVAIGRTLIADPYWPKKVKEGRISEIRRCISDLEGCLGHHVFPGLRMRCSVNPDVGHERQFAVLQPAPKPKKVFIAGSGPGGMEAARIAKSRGHDVILYEKEQELGGLFDVMAAAPYKEENLWLKDYYLEQMRLLDVTIRRGEALTVQTVEKEKPDAVILATGAKWELPDVPGKEKNQIATSKDILLKSVSIPDDVIVVRGASEGCEVAEFLAEMGKNVTIVEKRAELGYDLEAMTRELLIRRIQNDTPDWIQPRLKKPLDPQRPPVKVVLNSVIDAITDDGVIVVNNKMEKRHVAGQLVVFTMVRVADVSLLSQLESLVPELHAIGDCVKPGMASTAIYQGSHMARMI